MRVSDQELIERFVAEHGVTRIERPWPCKEVDGWSTQMGHAVAARKRGTKAMMETRKRDFEARMARLFDLNDRGYAIEDLAAMEKVSRNRMVDLFRKGGRPLGTSRKEKKHD